jgi:hypothetical protein
MGWTSRFRTSRTRAAEALGAWTVTDAASLDLVVSRLSARHPDLPPGRVIRCVLRCRRELRGAQKGPLLWPAVEEMAETRLAELRQPIS